jgi:peptidyl-prolyl cis-trans isomerase SurA
VESRIVVSDAEVATSSPTPTTPSARKSSTSPTSCSAPEGASPEQLARLRAKAEDVAARVARGEAFDKLAASYSDAPDALSGGNLGWRSAERLPGLFAEAVQPQAGRHHAHPAQRRRLPPRQGGRPQGRQPGRGPSQVQQTHARHILIKTSEIVSDADARRRLVDLRERVVQGGASFADLARQHSADISAAKGGDLGWIYPGDTVPEFEQAMDALKPGEISQPVQSPFGWHLIVVEERRVQDVSDDRKRAAARNALRERKSDEAFQDWLRQLRDRAYVEYRLEDR